MLVTFFSNSLTTSSTLNSLHDILYDYPHWQGISYFSQINSMYYNTDMSYLMYTTKKYSLIKILTKILLYTIHVQSKCAAYEQALPDIIWHLGNYCISKQWPFLIINGPVC